MQVGSRCAVNTDGVAAGSCCRSQPGGTEVAAFCAGRTWHLCDMRTGDCTVQRDESHRLRIHAVDFAPSAPHMLATASQDSTVKVWDCRCGLGLAHRRAVSNRVADARLPARSCSACAS